MRRLVMVVLACASVFALAGCVGSTDPASDVRAGQAQLNADGYTNNGPASWWWEYSPTRSVVAAGNGTQTKHFGPASDSNDVALNTVVTGLDHSQPYYFRACGQDSAAGSSKECGNIQGLYTAPGDSTFTPGNNATFAGAQNVQHKITVTAIDGSHTTVQELAEDPSETPEVGSDVLFPSGDGSECSHQADSEFQGYGLTPYFDNATCEAGNLSLTLGPYDDAVTVAACCDGALTVDLGAGDDYFLGTSDGTFDGNFNRSVVTGDAGNDLLIGGPGSDNLSGGDGNDTIYGNGLGIAQNGGLPDVLNGGNGNDSLSGNGVQDATFDCGPGDDTIYVTSGESYTDDGQCEHIEVESFAQQHQRAMAAMAKVTSAMQAAARDGRAALKTQLANAG